MAQVGTLLAYFQNLGALNKKAHQDKGDKDCVS
jgi:hypothetical protein